MSFLAVLVVALWASSALSQQPATSHQQLPDSPRPQKNAPELSPEPPSAANSAPEKSPIPPTPMPRNTQEQPIAAAPDDAPSEPDSQPAPDASVRTVPAASLPSEADRNSRNDLFVLRRQVNFVTVPVSVKDRDGHLVEGLLPKDFSVYENGTRQNLRFFTSDPFPLSVAVVVDLGMPDDVLSKVRDSLPALVGAFGQFDEVSIFTYGNTVKKWQDFTSPDKIKDSTLRQLKAQKGGTSGAPVVGGPLGQPGPVINGRNMDNTPNVPSMPTTQIEQSHVLNDAVLAASQDLARRGRSRRGASANAPEYRRVLFIISDGREVGSSASYADVMKVLLSNEITVYSVGVGGAAIPVYRKLQTLTLPRLGTGNILPKYASATGGQVFPEFDRSAIETAYSRVTEEARNQYTLGYTTRATPSSTYRSIEVRVTRPGLRVYARDGYYPVPARSQTP